MTSIDRCLLFLVCSPILVFIVHIITSRIAEHFGWRVAAQKLAFICIVFGNLPVGLLVWFLILQYADQASQFWGGVYCILVYSALGHIYFHLFNLTQTGIRAALMRDIAAQQLTINELIDRYDPSDSGERMQRLLDIGVVKQVDDRYFLQTQWLYYVGIICRAWGNLLGFSEKDNGYISSAKNKKRPLWVWLRNTIESNPYSWYFAKKLIYNTLIFLPHDKMYLAICHFNLNPGDLILDVGANDGISALSFFHIDPQVSVFSIEQNAIHGKGLERIKKRHASYNYRIVGAGSAKSSLTFFTPKYHFIYLHTFTSSNESQVKEAVIEVFGQQVGNHLEMIAIQSEIIALDDLALAPKVIKIDVEGFEYPVLQGLKITIMKYRPFIIIETCHDEGNAVVGFIKELKYLVLDYDYQLDMFQEFDTSSEIVNGNRNRIMVPIEKLSTLPFSTPHRGKSS